MKEKAILAIFLFGLLFVHGVVAETSTSQSEAIQISASEITSAKACPEGCTCEGETIVCQAEDNCKSPCIRSGDTCSCPAGQTSTCKIGCICTGTTMDCPAEYSCKAPCKKEGDVCNCQQESMPCPEGCKCEGNSATCPTQQTRSIEAAVETSTGTSAIILEKKENKLEISSQEFSAVSEETFIIKDSKLYMKTSTGDKQIKILPEEASIKAPEITKVKQIEIKDEAQGPTYSVRGTKNAKILFVVPVSMEIETKVNAETGEVISTRKPWWSFLAR